MPAVIKSIQGYRLFLENGFDHGSERPWVYPLESLDLLLVSVVFFMLGFGILKIFIPSDRADEKNPQVASNEKLHGSEGAAVQETSLVTLMIFAFTGISFQPGGAHGSGGR
ncbi:MAG: hypothetical protein MZW92_17110 [Comamonadaceae bacterium]|nr:hypothetical protein [Comamonadaceae bacterium]